MLRINGFVFWFMVALAYAVVIGWLGRLFHVW